MKTHDDCLVDVGIPIRQYCFENTLSLKHFTWLCENGNIGGARLHPRQKEWFIYPPVTILFNR